MSKTIQKRTPTVPTIRLLRSGQLTLPAEIRHDLGLKEGAFLEANVKNNSIVLTPKKLVEKNEAKERIFSTLEKVWERNKDLDPKEVERLVNEAVTDVRAKKRK